MAFGLRLGFLGLGIPPWLVCFALLREREREMGIDDDA